MAQHDHPCIATKAHAKEAEKRDPDMLTVGEDDVVLLGARGRIPRVAELWPGKLAPQTLRSSRGSSVEDISAESGR